VSSAIILSDLAIGNHTIKNKIVEKEDMLGSKKEVKALVKSKTLTLYVCAVY